LKVRVDFTLEGHDEPDETVELPVPEAPGAEDFGPGHWRWVGPLPRTRVDLTDEYCIGVYVLKRSGTEASILAKAEPTVRRRGVNATRKQPPTDGLSEKGHSCPDCDKTFLTKHALRVHQGRVDHPAKRKAPPADRDAADQKARTEERDRLFPGPKHRRPTPPAAPTAAPPPVAASAHTVERGGVVTLSDAEAVRDLVGRHFKGELSRPLAERFKTTQPVVVATVHRAYDLMDMPFSPTGPPNPMAKALWEDEMTDPARRAIAQRIAEGR
jgi:hypothetical protein